jgi:hypothetical protein
MRWPGWLLMCFVALGAACVRLPGAPRDDISFRTELAADSALRIAETQLRLHGYAIGARTDAALTTTARAVPQDLRNPRLGREARLWVLRVETGRETLTGLTTVRVAAFVAPARGATPETEPITSDNRSLFGEVEAVAGWIRDATSRRR